MSYRTCFSTEGWATSTLVVRTPGGWYVSKTVAWPGSQRAFSTHAVVVADADHVLSPGDFAGQGEKLAVINDDKGEAAGDTLS